LGIKFLENLFTNISNPILIAYLTQYSEKDLKLMFFREVDPIFECVAPFTFDHLVKLELNIIQRIIIDSIKSGDIEALER
jgi:hypothetical protein